MEKISILYNMLQALRIKKVCLFSFKKSKKQDFEKQSKKAFEGSGALKSERNTTSTLFNNREYGYIEFELQGASRNPSKGFEKLELGISKFLITLIRFYQRFISPLLPRTCRFYPTCSHYAIDALNKKGLFKGLMLSGWRILRCNPLSKGGFDPVR